MKFLHDQILTKASIFTRPEKGCNIPSLREDSRITVPVPCIFSVFVLKQKNGCL